jgi:hypothetical protein
LIFLLILGFAFVLGFNNISTSRRTTTAIATTTTRQTGDDRGCDSSSVAADEQYQGTF